jgi:hypothetical protein
MKKNPFMSLRPTRRIIRLKRYEQPPDGYYEDFLKEFHKRQRTELLNPSLSTLIRERLHSMVPELRVPAMAFAGAAAVAVIASIAIIRETPRLETPRAYAVSYTPATTYSQTPVTIQNVQPVSLRLDPLPQNQQQTSSILFAPSYLLPGPNQPVSQ